MPLIFALIVFQMLSSTDRYGNDLARFDGACLMVSEDIVVIIMNW